VKEACTKRQAGLLGFSDAGVAERGLGVAGSDCEIRAGGGQLVNFHWRRQDGVGRTRF